MKKILQLLILGIGVTVNSQTLLRQFTFNNTFYDTSNTDEFTTFRMSGGNLGYYTTGRSGAANTAYHFGQAEGARALISSGLPLGSAARTVALWVKFNTPAVRNYIFSYGSATANGCFGFSNNNDTQLELYTWGGGNSIIGNVSPVLNSSTWYHLVTSYDGANLKIYLNGTLLRTQAKSIDTQTGLFYLGATPQEIATFQAVIDDLQIYNGALSDSQVSNLYSNNTLSIADFSQNNLKVTLYPNPVNDILNIDVENEIKLVEIYNIQGKKVIQSSNKLIETNSLNSGIYMVRIEDVNGAVATQKLIKNNEIFH